MSKRNSLYSAMVHTLSQETATKERSLINRLNACQRYMGDIYKSIQAKIDEMKDEDRLDSASMLEIFKYLLCYDRKELWNPIVDGDPTQPDMEADRLLGMDGELTAEEYLEIEENKQQAYHKLSDLEKLRVNQIEGGACGISVHRLGQIAFGIGKLFLIEEGIFNLKGKEKTKLENGEYDEAFLKYAKAYHNGNRASAKKSKTQDKDKSDEAETPTLEAYENGELSPKDVESEDVLRTWYDQLDSRGKKAAITKELHKREREAQEN